MSGSSSFPELDLFNSSTVMGADGQVSFSNIFGTGSAIGDQSAIYDGTGAVPPASDSPNASLVVTGGSATTIPDGYSAVYDLSNNDTITGASSGLGVYLQNNSDYVGAAAAIPSTPVGRTQLPRDPANHVFGWRQRRDGLGRFRQPAIRRGRRSRSVRGGSGNTTLFGGTGSSASVLIGGPGTNSDWGLRLRSQYFERGRWQSYRRAEQRHVRQWQRRHGLPAGSSPRHDPHQRHDRHRTRACRWHILRRDSGYGRAQQQRRHRALGRRRYEYSGRSGSGPLWHFQGRWSYDEHLWPQVN